MRLAQSRLFELVSVSAWARLHRVDAWHRRGARWGVARDELGRLSARSLSEHDASLARRILSEACLTPATRAESRSRIARRQLALARSLARCASSRAARRHVRGRPGRWCAGSRPSLAHAAVSTSKSDVELEGLPSACSVGNAADGAAIFKPDTLIRKGLCTVAKQVRSAVHAPLIAQRAAKTHRVYFEIHGDKQATKPRRVVFVMGCARRPDSQLIKQPEQQLLRLVQPGQ